MVTYQAIADMLDETLEALVSLDMDRVMLLEGRMEVLSQANVTCAESSTGSILAKKRVLELVLRNSEENLNALNRLHTRNIGSQWVR
jgi:hypothetical protein